MDDTNRAPRRVSMAYILGFSNKPFKDGGPPVPAQPPPPRHPSAFKKMVSTPGGVLEWAASDGRRGRLTGPGKVRLSAYDAAPAAEATVVEKNAGDDEGGMGMLDIFADPPQKAASVKAAQDDDAEVSTWTKEEDEKLMELKDANKPWADIAEETGKKEHECRERFKQIKPADWKPSGAKGGNQKQGKQKGQKQKNNQNNQKDGGKKDGNKDENANGGFDASADNPWGGDSWGDNNNNNEATQNNDSWGNNGGTGKWGSNNGGNDNGSGSDNKSEKKDDNNNWDVGEDTGDTNVEDDFKQDNNGWGGAGGTVNTNTGDTWDKTGGGGGTGGGWGGPGGDGGNNTGWGDGNNTGNDSSGNAGFDAGGASAWGNENSFNNNSGSNDNNNNAWDGNNDGWGSNNNSAPNDNASRKNSSNKPHSNKSSGKPSSRSHSKQRSSSKSGQPFKSTPSEYELKPDSTFSADDLRLIARILQQDCHLVWDRVSWRFKDKTGRNLHPDVIEKKITGKVEERGSERGKR